MPFVMGSIAIPQTNGMATTGNPYPWLILAAGGGGGGITTSQSGNER